MGEKLYKIIFLDESKSSLTIHSRKLEPSSCLGLIEVSDLVFLDPSDIIVTSEDDKVRNIFKNVTKTFIPLGAIVRIDEINRDNKIKVIDINKSESNK